MYLSSLEKRVCDRLVALHGEPALLFHELSLEVLADKGAETFSHGIEVLDVDFDGLEGTDESVRHRGSLCEKATGRAVHEAFKGVVSQNSPQSSRENNVRRALHVDIRCTVLHQDWMVALQNDSDSIRGNTSVL